MTAPVKPRRTYTLAFALAWVAGPAAAQKAGEAMQFQGETTVTDAGPASRTAEKALKLYQRGDYYSASIELHKVVEGETGDTEPVRHKAEFFMGKTLYHLGFYAASLSYFDRVVQKGEAHPYYRATLIWLASLAGKVPPESAGILEKIGKYTRVELEQPELDKVRHELFYLLGRWNYTQGNLKEAQTLFSEVSRKSPYYVRAKFFEGITHVREYQAQPAAEAFKAILRHAIERPETEGIQEWEALANLSLARVFYSTHQWEQSLKYYDRIPPESPHWLAALFESSWAYYQIDGFQKALGNIHTLNAPYFESQFFPESTILRAVIYWKNCVYNRSGLAIQEFNEVYPPVKKEMEALLEKTQDPLEFFEIAQKIRRAKSGLPDLVERMGRSFLADRTVDKMFEYVEELQRELKMIDAADAAWKATAIASTVLQDLTLQESLAKNEAGQLARKRIERGRDEIQELVKQAIKVKFETLNALKGEAEAELRAEQVSAAVARAGQTVTIDDEHQMWPFSGEYWKDELGTYRFKVRSQCR